MYPLGWPSWPRQRIFSSAPFRPPSFPPKVAVQAMLDTNTLRCTTIVQALLHSSKFSRLPSSHSSPGSVKPSATFIVDHRRGRISSDLARPCRIHRRSRPGRRVGHRRHRIGRGCTAPRSWKGWTRGVGSTVLVSVVDVLVLVDVVGAFVVCSAAVVPNPSAPSSFAQPNGLSGPQLLLIPQPSDAMGARSRRTRANMTVLATIAGARPSTQGFSTGAAASADVPWAVSGAG
jgi:hypothetical protein